MKKRIVIIMALCLVCVMLFSMASCSLINNPYKKVCKYIEENGEFSESEDYNKNSLKFNTYYKIYFFGENRNKKFWISYYDNGLSLYFTFDKKNPGKHYWSCSSSQNFRFSASGYMYSENYTGSQYDIEIRVSMSDYEGSIYLKDTYEEISESLCYMLIKDFDKYLQEIDIGVSIQDLGFDSYQAQ